MISGDSSSSPTEVLMAGGWVDFEGLWRMQWVDTVYGRVGLKSGMWKDTEAFSQSYFK